ncbi:hypothetical protein ABZ858_14035 [Streptomyces sp. NPDC047017]|uniref:hypothetical protein n=1 Tax=Streptomyces sp. NPDC047017 TaxID=3155024 RepID=UPI0033DE951F
MTKGAALLAATMTAVGVAWSTAPMAGATAAGTPPTTTTITVQTDHTLATVRPDALGADDWQTDRESSTPATARLLRADGIRLRELNTGPWDDTYRWRTNTFDHDPITDTMDPSPKAVPWQSWASGAKKAGAQMMVHVNYGSTADDGPGGTDIGPQEAAAWVRQANIVDHDHITYWAIGEEVWGNGFMLPTANEPDHHALKTPAEYGRNVVRFAKAMKAVDPTIKIGVELAPFSSVNGKDWNDPVLAAAGDAVDFADIHWYNYGQGAAANTDAALFASTGRIAPTMAAIRGQLTANLGAHARQVRTVIGETNTNAQDPGVQSTTLPSALYAADDISTWLEQGASNVAWFDSHHGAYPDKAGSPDDPDGLGYGTWGMLSDGPQACEKNTQGQEVCEPPLNTPYPSYYGVGMAGRLAAPGARLVATAGGGSPIVSHAAVQRDGKLVVLVENQDPNASHDVRLDYPGYHAGPVAVAYSYGAGSTSPARSLVPAHSVQLPPYSMTELVLSRS